MTFERGDIVLVPFPFTDLSASKRRPVLALTRPDGYGDFLAMPITSRPRPENGVTLTQADMTDGVLPAASWVRADRVVTLNASLVIKRVGRVAQPILAASVQRLCLLIGGPSR